MPDVPPEILVVDDHDDVREALRLLFKGEGIATTGAASPKPALESVRRKDFAMALIDLNYHRDTTSGAEGLELLREIRELDATLPVVVMTAWGGVEIAVEAIRRGACDFVEKPWNNERLLSIVRNQLELARTRRTARRLDAAQHSEGAPELIAESPEMKGVLGIVAQVARSDAAILVTGENGTGKGLIARAIHAASNRQAETLVNVNMGSRFVGRSPRRTTARSPWPAAAETRVRLPHSGFH